MSQIDVDKIAPMWARAIKRYEEITDKPLVDASLSGISTVQGLTELIDNENDAFTNFRAKRQALFGAFSSALLPLEIVMGETANGVFPPSAIVFSAVVHLVSSAKGVSDKYDAIIELMTALKDFTVRLETYTRQVISTQLTDKLGAIVVALIEVLAISREAIRHGRVRSFGRSLAGGNQDAKQAMDKLIRLVDSERGLAVAETLTETKSIASYVSNINTKVSALYDKVEAISMSRDAALGDVHDTKSRSAVDKLKNILQPIMASEDVYWAIQRNRVAGTGTWVWEEPLFKSWLRGERLVLWISGNPGAGKSYIASNIINFLQEQYPQKVNHVSHVSVVYFYFKEDDSKTRSFPQALRDMAFMAAENDQVYAKFLANRLESADGLRSTSGAWKKLIFDFFVQGNRDSQLVMLLDGMDESFQADREEFFDLARDVCENGNIRLVMLGRPQIVEEIIRIMDVPTIPTIGVTPKTNFADIVRYINTTISKSSSLRRVSKAKRKELAAMISDKAGGMFLWVDLMMKNILKRTTITGWSSIINALDQAPKEIDTMIQHVLEGYSNSFEDALDAAVNVNEILAWIACSPSPLKLKQLQVILRWVHGPNSEPIWLERTLRIQLASILVLTREDGLNTADLQESGVLSEEVLPNDEDSDVSQEELDGDQTHQEFDSNPATTHVTFGHATILDFFRRPQQGKVSGGGGPPVGVDFHEAQAHCAGVLLDVLCQKAFPEAGVELPKLLWDHAKNHWHDYFTSVDITKTSETEKKHIGGSLARLLLQDHGAWDFIAFMPYDIAVSTETAKRYNTWLSDPQVLASLPESLRAEYHNQIKDSQLDVLVRTIRGISWQWFNDLKGDPLAYCWYVALFRQLRHNVEIGDTLTAEIVVQTAEWCELEQTPTWHRRLGTTLRQLKQYSLALEHFWRAIELEPTFWVAHHGVAYTYNVMGDKESHIKFEYELLDKLKAAYPEPNAIFRENLHRVHHRLGAAYQKVDDHEKSLQHYREGLVSKPRCWGCVTGITQGLRKEKRWEDIMSLIRELDSDDIPHLPGKDYSRLVEIFFLHDFVDEVFWTESILAAELTRQNDYLIAACRRGLSIARRERRPLVAMVLEYTIARILLRTDQADEAARICECLILTYRTAESTRDTTAAAGLMLADYCIGMALKSRNGQDASEAEKYGWLLEAMALSAGVKLPSTSHQGKKVLGLFVVEEQYFTWTGLCAPREVVLKLGDYYQCMGRKDLARDCFRQGLNEAIRLLLDDDPGNDSEAWTLVVYILLAAGDDENAISALLARITILVKESLTEETKQEEVEEVSGGLEDKLGDVAAEIKAEGYAETRSKNGAETKSEDGTGTMSKEGATATAPTSEQDDGDAVLSTVLPVECVGCLEPIRLSDMFICRFCFDTGFCSDCLEKVQDGTHPRKICGSSHEWLLFPKVRKAQLLPPKDGMVQSAGKWVELETWANNLGKNWDLEKLAIKGQ